MLLIIHIPKTAGTSLRQSLLEQYGQSRLALDYGGQSEVTSSVVNQYLYQGEASLGVKKLVDELRATGYQAIIGHYALSKYGEFFRADEVITLVREPLVRSCSEYLHKSSNGAFAGTFSEFMQKPVNQNIQARLLNGYKKEMFIGVTERYSDSLEVINKLLGLQVNLKIMNLGERGGGERFHKDLSQDITDHFYEINQRDVKLHQETSRRLNELIPASKKKMDVLRRLLSRNPM